MGIENFFDGPDEMREITKEDFLAIAEALKPLGWDVSEIDCRLSKTMKTPGLKVILDPLPKA